MDLDASILDSAMREWSQSHFPRSFLEKVFPIIRDVDSIDLILSRMPQSDRALVVRELQSEYGPHIYFSDDASEWGYPASAFTDLESFRREHEEFVAHAVHVAIPAIRSWLVAHADEVEAARQMDVPVRRRRR